MRYKRPKNDNFLSHQYDEGRNNKKSLWKGKTICLKSISIEHRIYLLLLKILSFIILNYEYSI